MRKYSFISFSEEETKKIARKLAEKIRQGDVVILSGEFGSGKTVFSKGLCSYFSVEESEVSSPSFTLLNIYQGTIKIYHLDLYRIEKLDETDYQMFQEYIEDEKAVKLIEWNKMNIEIPFKTFKVEIKHINENTREIIIEE
ncbi:MAG: tRNA (adenosine(37)-N6)-threonylcarbamoyltransferase complex ATPase subunit type 1 TsaE [Brevinematia bacterium]